MKVIDHKTRGLVISLTHRPKNLFRLASFLLVYFTLSSTTHNNTTLKINFGTDAIAAPVRSYEQQLEQVRLYIKKKMYEAAKNELEHLKFSDRGRDDERVYTALAKVNYKLHYITEALDHLRQARQLTRDPNTRSQLSNLYEQWLSAFGLVRFESIDELQRGRVELIRKRKLINKQRQSALLSVQKQLSSAVNLPVSVYLPYGSYTANGVSFKLERNQPTPIVELMVVPIDETVREVEKKLNIPWAYVSAGAVAIIGAGIGAYLLSQDSAVPSQKLTITISDGR